MTDLEKFVELYRSVGIELTPEPSNELGDGRKMLVLTAKETPKVTGYTSFYTEIYFDEHGKFVEQSVWE